MPGVTNKILSHFVDKVFLGYKDAEKYFSTHAKMIVTGNPVRRDVTEADRQEGYKKLGLDPMKRPSSSLAGQGERGPSMKVWSMWKRNLLETEESRFSTRREI